MFSFQLQWTTEWFQPPSHRNNEQIASSPMCSVISNPRKSHPEMKQLSILRVVMDKRSKLPSVLWNWNLFFLPPVKSMSKNIHLCFRADLLLCLLIEILGSAFLTECSTVFTAIFKWVGTIVFGFIWFYKWFSRKLYGDSDDEYISCELYTFMDPLLRLNINQQGQLMRKNKCF